MKRREYTKDSRQFIIEEYDSFSELIKTCKGRPRNWSGHYNESTGEFDDSRWIGCDTYQEAEEMLRFGWTDMDKIAQLKDKVRDLSKAHEVQKIGFKNDIVGFAPIVPNAVIGIPQNMINSVRTPKKNKVVTILADMTVSCSTGWETYLEWGAELIAKIVQLEKSGFRVRLEYVNTFSNDGYGKVHACRVLMKSENQPFDIKRYMFPLAHTAMFRGLMFDWYEKLPNAERLGGYGCSIVHHSGDKQKIKKEISNGEDVYYIVCKEDINEAMKGVK